MNKKILSVLLTLIMVISMIPAVAYADSQPVDTEWWNFRNSEENNGVTDRPTPTNAGEVNLKFAVKYGSGWGAAPTPPIIIDGYIYSII